MNKYARIDKLIKKSDFYRFVWAERNAPISRIALYFRVSPDTVTRAIKQSLHNKNYPVIGSYLHKRMAQLYWSFPW